MPIQRTLSFAPLPMPSTLSRTHATPCCNKSRIINYACPEQIEEPFQNPNRDTLRTITQRLQEEDVEIDNKDEDNKDEEMDDESREELTIVPDPNTPSRQNLPSTIVVKRRCIKRQPRNERDENT